QDYSCEVCEVAKARRMSYKNTKPYRAQVPLERVHIDKGGPITPPTFGGKRLYELYVDEGSRYKWLCLLTSKSESFDNFKKFYVTVERQHEYKLKTIMTDNAKQYMSKENNAYCSGIGIEQLQGKASQVVTVPLQDYPSENVEVEDDEDEESVSTHRTPQRHSTQVSVEASTVETDRNPIATSQPDEGQIFDPGREEHLSSNQESSDSDVEPENPTGLEAISGGSHHQVLSVDPVNDTPQSFADIEASPDKHAWMDATQEEYDALVNNGTWVLTGLPAGRKALACEWLWRNKFNAVGHPNTRHDS
ncbi:hypothetical protein As57867_004730, partial [Aphanomyces stellatus]